MIHSYKYVRQPTIYVDHNTDTSKGEIKIKEIINWLAEQKIYPRSTVPNNFAKGYVGVKHAAKNSSRGWKNRKRDKNQKYEGITYQERGSGISNAGAR